MRNAILIGTTQLKSIKNTRTHIRCTLRALCSTTFVIWFMFLLIYLL